MTKTSISNKFKNKLQDLSVILAITLGFILPLSTSLTNIILVLLTVVWLLGGYSKSFIKAVKHPVSIATLALFALYLVRATYVSDETISTYTVLHKMARLLYIPVFISIFSEGKNSYYGLKAFSAAMILTVLGCVFKLSYFIFVKHNYNLFSTDIELFKDYIITGLFVAFYIFVLAHKTFTNKEQYFLTYVIIAVCFTYLFLLSKGRTGQIIFLGLLGLFLLQKLSFKAVSFVGVFVLCLSSLLFVVPNNFQKRMELAIIEANEFMVVLNSHESKDLEKIETSVGLRMYFAISAWEVIKQKPWLGWGTGYLRDGFMKMPYGEISMNPHNQYLFIMTQLGIVGLIGLLLFFLVILKYSFELPSIYRWLSQGMLLSMVTGCIVNSWLNDFTPTLFFVYIIGLCFSKVLKSEGVLVQVQN